MNIEFTKDVPEEVYFKNVVVGEVFSFSDDEDVYIKIPEVRNDLNEYANSVELYSGELGCFPIDYKVRPMRHKLLIYKD